MNIGVRVHADFYVAMNTVPLKLEEDEVVNRIGMGTFRCFEESDISCSEWLSLPRLIFALPTRRHPGNELQNHPHQGHGGRRTRMGHQQSLHLGIDSCVRTSRPTCRANANADRILGWTVSVGEILSLDHLGPMS